MSNLFRYGRSSVVSGLLMLMSVGALAYDFKRMEAAIESLSPTTQSEWERKATAGEPIAQNVTGMAYKYGIGVAQDQAVSSAQRQSRARRTPSSTSRASTKGMPTTPSIVATHGLCPLTTARP
ncbi:hypothetical protein OU678_25310 [Escherichia coli]|nr:hypothetical protein [Escherichia coli]